MVISNLPNFHRRFDFSKKILFCIREETILTKCFVFMKFSFKFFLNLAPGKIRQIEKFGSERKISTP